MLFPDLVTLIVRSPSSLLKSAPADVGQGGKQRGSAVYTGVNEHFEPFSNAERRRPSFFQQTASSLLKNARGEPIHNDENGTVARYATPPRHSTVTSEQHSTKSDMRALVLFCCLFAGAITLPAGLAATIEPIDRIVAVVNDDVITETELEERVNTIIQQLKQQRRPMPPSDILRNQVLERLIVERAQLQEAKTLGIQVDEDTLNQTLRRIASDNSMSLTDFRGVLERDGYDFTQFREDIRRELVIRRLQDRQVNQRVTVSQQDVDQFLASQDASSDRTTEYRIAQILVAVPEAAAPAEVDKARARVHEILDKLKAGDDFSALAVAYSDGQQALDGGDMGWRRAVELPTLFAGVVPQLETGQVSDIVRGPSGFHLVKLVDKRGEQRHTVGQTHARHILIPVDKLTSDAAAKDKLQALRTRVLAGQEFGPLAKQYSSDKISASQGGDLGWVQDKDLVPEFVEAMSALQPGEISQPFQSRFGWHIVQVLARRTVDDTETFLRDQAQQALRQRRIEEETELWLRRLRDEAYVEMRLNNPN
jgi:peptidyl-prolyl cis-trans isomerase SurA